MGVETRRYTSTSIERDPQRPMRIDMAAEYLGLSKSTLYKLTSGNKIGHSKPNGKTIYFRKEDLDNWATSRRVASREEVRRNVQ